MDPLERRVFPSAIARIDLRPAWVAARDEYPQQLGGGATQRHHDRNVPLVLMLTRAVPSLGNNRREKQMSEIYEYAGGMSFHLIYDAAAGAAPHGFRDALEAAATLLSQAIQKSRHRQLKID
jgi:hypothetical protein